MRVLPNVILRYCIRTTLSEVERLSDILELLSIVIDTRVLLKMRLKDLITA